MNPETLTELASLALAEYGLKNYHLTFLGHSDNATFHAETTSGAFLLRLHRPAGAGYGTQHSDPGMIESELRWLAALRRNTSLTLQEPVRNRKRELVTMLDTPEGPLYCSMLGWLEGEPISRDTENEETAAQIGEIIGQLHHAARLWRIPGGFRRPAREINYYHQALNALLTAVNDGRVAYPDFRQFQISIDILEALLARLPKTRQARGLLHGDLHRGNFILHNGQIRVIDFSLCAFGPFTFDLSICLSGLCAENRPALVESYMRYMILPADFARLIEGQYIGSMVGTFVMALDRPEHQEWLVERFPRIAQDFAARFNRDERFWFTE